MKRVPPPSPFPSSSSQKRCFATLNPTRREIQIARGGGEKRGLKHAWFRGTSVGHGKMRNVVLIGNNVVFLSLCLFQSKVSYFCEETSKSDEKCRNLKLFPFFTALRDEIFMDFWRVRGSKIHTRLLSIRGSRKRESNLSPARMR